jgi:hypothetical protein
MATKSPKAVVVIKAPKIQTAWTAVCTVSSKSESDIVKAIENLQTVMVTESRLSVADRRSFIKQLEDSGKVSNFVKSSHVSALETWLACRAKVEGFKGLSVAKQLSLATASYDLLKAGNGEQIKSSKNEKGEHVPAVENLAKAVAGARKAKSEGAKAGASVQTDKPAKVSNLQTIVAFTALLSTLDINALSEKEHDALANLQIVFDNMLESLEA